MSNINLNVILPEILSTNDNHLSNSLQDLKDLPIASLGPSRGNQSKTPLPNNGASWTWGNLGRPYSGAMIKDWAGDIDVYGTPYVLGICKDGNLWACIWNSTSGWSWGNLGNGGSSLNLAMGAMIVNGGPNVFAFADDGNMYTCVIQQNGSFWWANLSHPNGGWLWSMRVPMGTVVANQHPYVLGAGNDGNVWGCAYTGGGNNYGWNWSNLGSIPSALKEYVGTAIAGVSPNVFVIDIWGQLYSFYYKNNQWNWINLKSPGISVTDGVGVVPVNGNPGVMVLSENHVGNTGELLMCSYVNSEWGWYTLGAPHGAGYYLSSAMGVGAATINNQPCIFVTGTNNNLWMCSPLNQQFAWTDLGKPITFFYPVESMGIITAGSCPNIMVVDLTVLGLYNTLYTCWLP